MSYIFIDKSNPSKDGQSGIVNAIQADIPRKDGKDISVTYSNPRVGSITEWRTQDECHLIPVSDEAFEDMKFIAEDDPR